MADKPVFDFVVISTRMYRVAVDMTSGINYLGIWDAVVRSHQPAEDLWDVMLPGQSTPETEIYMRGYVDGWMMACQAIAKKEAEAKACK